MIQVMASFLLVHQICENAIQMSFDPTSNLLINWDILKKKGSNSMIIAISMFPFTDSESVFRKNGIICQNYRNSDVGTCIQKNSQKPKYRFSTI